MNKKLIYLLILAFVVFDLGYSFIQYLSLPLDGDMAWNLLPFKEVKNILNSPFGFDAFLKDTTYPNPNRFFCHWTYRTYLILFPLYLQNFISPVESVYVACAIAQLLTHVLLLYLLSSIVTGKLNGFKIEFWIVAALLTPLFQINGYDVHMGIIDKSTTYTFFYALPCVYLLIYFLPFIFSHFHNKKIIPDYLKFIWLLLIPLVCLSGPLNTGIALVFSLILLIKKTHQFLTTQTKGSLRIKLIDYLKFFSIDYWIFIVPVSLGSIYSLYVGSFNDLTIGNKIPLLDAYSLLPKGIYYLVSQKLGIPLLLIVLFINWFVINKNYRDTPYGIKILSYYKYVGYFALIYILMLPLGGYRPYRPNILRYDTILPITLSLLFLYALGALFILKNITKKNQYKYIFFLVIVCINYTLVDEPQFDRNECEKQALTEIYLSNDCDYKNDYGCSVLTWGKNITNADIATNKELLRIWNICP